MKVCGRGGRVGDGGRVGARPPCMKVCGRGGPVGHGGRVGARPGAAMDRGRPVGHGGGGSLVGACARRRPDSERPVGRERAVATGDGQRQVGHVARSVDYFAAVERQRIHAGVPQRIGRVAREHLV